MSTQKMSTQKMRQHVQWFRDSSAYINAHRNRRFVIYLSGTALADPNLPNVIGDIKLLNSLGVKLVLVHGSEHQLTAELQHRVIKEQFAEGIRITDEATLDCLKQVAGQLHIELEAALSTGLINAPAQVPEVPVSSGNFVKAKPMGIIQGTDYLHTGEVRKVNTAMIDEQLNRGAIVLISPLGFSPSGEIFNLDSQMLAAQVATELQADKLILFDTDPGILDKSGHVISELQPSDIDQLVNADQPEKLSRTLKSAVYASQLGVARCHLISYSQDGALLEELFTRDGAGTQVCQESYEQIREATIDDVNGIINLIRPLEIEGVLVRRSRELLETEISKFFVIIRDSAVVGCAALYPFENSGELACIVTHPEYRNSERGDQLLQMIEKQALFLNIESLFVLTTRSGHWFLERGFEKASPELLPTAKKELYNYQRGSSVLVKQLTRAG